MVSATRATADYFFQALDAGRSLGVDPKVIANWIMGDVASSLNRDGLAIEQCRVSAVQLAGLIARIADGTVSNKIGREIFASLWAGEFDSADAAISAKGLQQIQDTGLIAQLVDEVLTANPKMVEELKGGKDKALNALVGQVMKKSQGKANPQQVTDLIRSKI